MGGGPGSLTREGPHGEVERKRGGLSGRTCPGWARASGRGTRGPLGNSRLLGRPEGRSRDEPGGAQVGGGEWDRLA